MAETPERQKLHVLFVSCSRHKQDFYRDASARYRCFFPAESLNAEGVPASVVHIEQSLTLDLASFDVIVVHRPTLNLATRLLLWRAGRLSIPLVADVDDLLFQPDVIDDLPAVCSGGMSKRLARARVLGYQAALARFRFITCSTQPLRDELQHLFIDADVQVISNAVPPRWFAPWSPGPMPERKIIRYLPGSGNHDHDFAMINQALGKLMSAFPQVELEVFGPIGHHYGALPSHRVRFRRAVPYEALPRVMHDSWVTLAPLVDNRFNRCKSGLKFWESALLGVPVVASPIPDIRRFDCSGLRFATGLNQWSEQLGALLDIRQWQQAQLSALATARAQCTTRSTVPLWHHFLAKVVYG